MQPRYTPISLSQGGDKQLRTIALESVLEKRRLDQALNTKEFAVLAGISYSTARAWFRQPGFPCFRGVVFWSDFAAWRTTPKGCGDAKPMQENVGPSAAVGLPPRAARILLAA